MLRLFAVLIPMILLSATAHADRRVEVLTQINDPGDACARLREKMDPKGTCTSAGKVTAKAGWTFEVIAAADPGTVSYGIVIMLDGKPWVSQPIELVLQNCGMQKCDLLDRHKPKPPRVLDTQTPAVAVEFLLRSHHEHTDDSSGKAKQVTTGEGSAAHYIAGRSRNAKRSPISASESVSSE